MLTRKARNEIEELVIAGNMKGALDLAIKLGESGNEYEVNQLWKDICKKHNIPTYPN